MRTKIIRGWFYEEKQNKAPEEKVLNYLAFKSLQENL
jgi:hypothetical protein